MADTDEGVEWQTQMRGRVADTDEGVEWQTQLGEDRATCDW